MSPRSAKAILAAPEVMVAAEYAKFAAASSQAPEAANSGDVALLASFMPMKYVTKFEGAIAAGLRSRGWRVEVLTTLTTAPLVQAYHGKVHGLRVHYYEDFVDFADLRTIDPQIDQWLSAGDELDFATVRTWSYRSVPVGVHTLATVSLANPQGRIHFDHATRTRLRRTLRRSMLWVDAALRANSQIRPKLILANEKGLVGSCEVFYAATRSQIDFVQWVSCQEPNSTMLKRYRRDNERDHPFSLGPESWRQVQELPWQECYREQLLETIQRGYKEGGWFRYKRLTENQRQSERAELLARLQLDPAKRTAIIYSHILNDANLFYGEDLFQGGYEQWLVETVRAALENPRVNWVLKVHPANRGRNRVLGYTGEFGEVLAIKRAFGALPESLRVVYPDDEVSPLSYFGITDWGVTVRGTIGLELPCFGIPVITAGTGRYSHKGFTEDSETAPQYLDKLRSIDSIPRLSEDRVRLAILYALAVFRARPAHYGQTFIDVDPQRATDMLERDFSAVASLPSLQHAVATPQWRRITDFLVAQRDTDFFFAGESGGQSNAIGE
jgi:hypothetical protein